MGQTFSFLLYPRKSKIILSKMLNDDEKKVEIFYANVKTLRTHKANHTTLQYLKKIMRLS